MSDPFFDQQLRDRLAAIDAGADAATPVPDLPLRDVLVVVIALILSTVGLVWWAI